MEEKEYAGSYRIEQMLRFGKKHFVLGLDDKAEEKYLLAERHTNAFGYEYDGYVCTEYEGNRFTLPGHPTVEREQVARNVKYVQQCLKEIQG